MQKPACTQTSARTCLQFGILGRWISIRTNSRFLLEACGRYLECCDISFDTAVGPPDLLVEFLAVADRGEPTLITAPAGAINVTVREAVANPLRIVSACLEWAARRAPGYQIFHAGVVGWPGGAMILPGCSRAGKSTLTAWLGRAGFSVFSDEAAVVAAVRDPTVAPFPRSIVLRRDSLAGLGFGTDGLLRCDADGYCAPLSLIGAWRARRPERVRRVVFPRFAPGESTAITSLPRGEALRRLMATAIPQVTRNDKVAGLDTAIGIVMSASAHEIRYSQTADAVSALQRLAHDRT